MVIEAAAPLLGAGTRLLIVGNGEERAHLEETAAKCGVANRVVFTGERHDVAAMLSAIDLFVASSKQETFGLSVLEALANGAPVLYTTCPALDGLGVDRARQVPSTAEGLRAAMAAELRSGPRERVSVPAIREAYGIDAVTRRIDDLYDRLAASRSRIWRRRTARTVGAPRPAYQGEQR
jgi:glycosyltransferase involved in cell wall biosynthesis